MGDGNWSRVERVERVECVGWVLSRVEHADKCRDGSRTR